MWQPIGGEGSAPVTSPDNLLLENIKRGSMAFSTHESPVMKSEVWLTPPEIIDDLGPFDLDPCSAPKPRPWDTASNYYTLPVDGLIQPWYGRVWLNPPYSRKVSAWLSRLADHGHGTALVFARTDTAWFEQTVWTKASALFFLHGRVKFYNQYGVVARHNAGAPSVLVSYGNDDAQRLKESTLRGTFVNLK